MLPFYLPTNILIVDDDPAFLESFAYRYGDRFLCQTNKSPDEAIKQLKQHYGSVNTDSLLGSHPIVSATGWWTSEIGTVQLDLCTIQAITQQENRSDCISVVIVDYAMPSMTGVEFCQKIRHLPVKRLLLTGKTGNATAVDAFNKGLIDRFIVKQDPQIATRLPQEIENLQKSFIADLTLPAMTARSRPQEMAFLEDPAFQAHFEELKHKYKVTEYYLSTSPTGIFMLDAHGTKTSVIVYNEDMMRAAHETARAVGAPQPLLEQIKNRTVVVAFPTSTGLYEPQYAVDWAHYTHTAQPIGDTPTWWMAVFRAPKSVSAT